MTRTYLWTLFLAWFLVAHAALAQAKGDSQKDEIRLITLDPGHFHAALFHKEMLPGVSKRVSIYAPFGPDLLLHLNRMAGFNLRKDNPTRWELEIYAEPDFFERMLRERRGNVVVLSGRGQGKVDRVLACIENGFHILADKPWILDPADLPKVQKALDLAEKKGVVAYDGMTQRFEITDIIPRELVNDPQIFGERTAGSEAIPAATIESVHYLMKLVAGVPNLRPVWFFDVEQQGEGLTDLGTHLADLVQWTLFPDQPLDWRADIQVTSGTHWPTVLSRADFQRVTGAAEYPESLRRYVTDDRLEYYCNNSVQYVIRGVHARLTIRWYFEATAGETDTQVSSFRGSKSRVEVRQGKEEKYVPEVYIVPNRTEDKAAVLQAVRRKIEALQGAYPGSAVRDQGDRIWVAIPDRYRVGHEAHFKMLIETFLQYVRNPKMLPAWERPCMMAKYHVTTKGVGLARRSGK